MIDGRSEKWKNVENFFAHRCLILNNMPGVKGVDGEGRMHVVVFITKAKWGGEKTKGDMFVIWSQRFPFA